MPISTRKAPSSRTVGDFRQLLVFLQISHPPAVYILVLEVQCCLHTRPSSVTVVSGGLSLGAYQHPAGTQWDPSARTGADFRQSLAFLQVSHPPVLYILVLAVWCCLHRWPSCVPGVAEGLSSDAYQHSAGTQCPNYRGFPSVAGMSACLASTCALHTGAGSVAFSAQTPLWCAWGV